MSGPAHSLSGATEGHGGRVECIRRAGLQWRPTPWSLSRGPESPASSAPGGHRGYSARASKRKEALAPCSPLLRKAETLRPEVRPTRCQTGQARDQRARLQRPNPPVAKAAKPEQGEAAKG